MKLCELREEAKRGGLKGYCILQKDQLHQLLNGERITYNLRRNQVCQETQTEFEECYECSLKKVIHHLTLKVAAAQRIVEDDGVKIDADTGEVLGTIVETSYRS